MAKLIVTKTDGTSFTVKLRGRPTFTQAKSAAVSMKKANPDTVKAVAFEL